MPGAAAHGVPILRSPTQSPVPSENSIVLKLSENAHRAPLSLTVDESADRACNG